MAFSPLFLAALDADAAFQAALVRVYGSPQGAADNRYKSTHPDSGLMLAKMNKTSADAAWRDECAKKER